MRHRFKIRLLHGCLFLTTVLLSQTAMGTDIVWLHVDSDQADEDAWMPPTPVYGRLSEYTATDCRYRPSNQKDDSVVDVGQVAWLYQPLTRKEIRAREYFERRQYEEFVKRIPGIVSTHGIPEWRKQYISVLAAYAQWDGGAYKSSLDMVAELDPQRLTPISLAVLPIQWTGAEARSTASAEAIDYLNHPSPAVRIVAASWLLSTRQEEHAVRTLHQLSNGKHKTISLLAEAVLWRHAPEETIKNSPADFLATLNEIPAAMRHAPSQLLADKLGSVGLHAEAKKIRSMRSPIPHQIPLK